LILLGIFVGFFGNTLVNAVIMVVITSFFSLVISYGLFSIVEALNLKTPDWALWVLLAASVVIAGAIGFLLMRKRSYGIAILCGWGGALLGLIITGMFQVGNTYVFYTIVILTTIVCAFAGLKFEKFAIMLITSFIGAYGTVRGISLYAGGFPSETSIHSQIKSGVINWDSFPKTLYAYAAGIVVLTIICMYFQWNHGKKKQQGERYKF
jgi:hypothetical protein